MNRIRNLILCVALAATVCAGTAYAAFPFYSTDTSQDWIVGDFELLHAFNDWRDGTVSDWEMLHTLDFWAAGGYWYDRRSGTWKAAGE